MRPCLRLLAVLAGGLWLAASVACAEDVPFGFTTTRSHSGQFVVSGRQQIYPLPETLTRTTATNWIRLQPALLAMTCERVKDAFLLRLGQRDAWQGRITLIIRPIRRLDDPVRVAQTRFKDGWGYRVEIPDAIEADRLVRFIVQALVVEWSNRHATGVPADVPLWLTEGFAQLLLNDPALNLILQPPAAKQNSLLLRETSLRGRRPPPLAAARAYFASHEPLDFEDLCWPPPDPAPGVEGIEGAGSAGYRYSAECFVAALLNLRGGGHSLATMLDDLGRCRNWQTAFLPAFGKHFSRTLDVDKWWSLELAHFLKRGDALTWRPTESLRQLNAVLLLNVQTAATNAPGTRALMPLTEFLKQAPPRQQEEVLQLRLPRLEALVPRVSPSLAPLTQEYLKLLQAHARTLERGLRGTPSQRLNQYAFKQATQKLTTQLAALDRRRAQFGTKPGTPLPTSQL